MNDDPLGTVPTEQLMKDLAAFVAGGSNDNDELKSKLKTFIDEFNALLDDDVNERDRQTQLISNTDLSTSSSSASAASERKRKQHQQDQLVAATPQQQYMFLPLGLLREFVVAYQQQEDEEEHEDPDELLEAYLMSATTATASVEPRLRKLFGENRFKPLQVVFRAPLPTCTASERKAHRDRHRAARAHQEREAYNRMMRGSATVGDGAVSRKFVIPTADATAAQKASAMHLSPHSGGVGFINKDNFSSSSRAEVEQGLAASTGEPPAKNFIQRISRDIGMGLDVPLMAAAGAVVGYYACFLRGMSTDECSIGAAVMATVFFLVDGGLVLMRLAREDLVSASSKKRMAKESQQNAARDFAAVEKKPRVVKREVLTGPVEEVESKDKKKGE